MSLGTFSNLLDFPKSNSLVMRQEFTQISILIDAFHVLFVLIMQIILFALLKQLKTHMKINNLIQKID